MIAATYARKSTDQTGVAADARSVTRQVEGFRACAAQMGWTVSEDHIFVDDGYSGAEFANRPAFVRLMNALEPRAPFDVLVISELSRLGREQFETGYAVKQLSQAGVKVWSYLEDREVQLDTPTDKFVMSAMSFAAEIEREQARQRTYDAMQRKARAGQVTGGRVFGYDNVRTDGGPVVRIINETEATIVRQIFDLYLAGHGVRGIAKLLNQQGAPSPHAQRGRASGWSGATIWELLRRPAYNGEYIWNQTKKRDRWGQRHQTPRPEGEWVRLPVPELRIVDEDVWSAVQARRAAAQQSYSRVNRGERFGRPANGRESKYLLTGLTRCDVCGHSLIVMSRSHRSRRAFFYRCGGFHSKGSAVCSNNVQLPLEAADNAILGEIEAYVLHPQVVARAVALALDELQPAPGRVDAERKHLVAERTKVEREIENIVACIKRGQQFASLDAELGVLEGRQAALTDQLGGLDRVCDFRFDRRQVERDLVTKLDDWRGLLRSEVREARPILRLLVPDRITFEPAEIDGLRGCRYSGVFRLGALFDGIISGQERWRPQREPRPKGASSSSGDFGQRKFSPGSLPGTSAVAFASPKSRTSTLLSLST